MKINFKNNFLGYFRFYYAFLGNKFILNMILGVLVSLMDGMGLAMFMPLLQSAGTDGSAKTNMGNMHYLTDFIEGMGFSITINTILVMLVSLFIIKGLLKFAQQSYQVKLWHLFMRKVRYELLDDLQGLSYRGFLMFDAGKIQNTLSSEVQRLYQTVKFYFNATQSGVMLLTYIAMAFFANFQFAILVAIGAGLSNLFYKKIYTSTKKASIGVAKKGDEFSKYLTQSIHYFKYLKATNHFHKFAFHLRRVIQGSEQLYRKMGFSSAITTSFKEPMIIIIVSGVIYLQMNFMGTGISTILLSLLFFYRALSFLLLVQNSWQNFIQNAGAISSISELMNSMHGMQEPLVANKFTGLTKQVHLKNIDFAYGETKVLNNADVLIPKNKTIAIIGESGSGKTTLANMVAGLIDPSNGAVLLDDVPLTDYNKDTFRSRIGYISQEAVIFNDSVFNNITFWEEQTKENLAKFWHVIELASLTQFVTTQPGNENAMLGDNGIMVSGGQKQRISIARELYKDVEILILDEATSALDSETEKVIQDNIDNLHGSYTMIIIAHRLSTIKNADIIYLLEKGTVSASGSFEQMLERSERFKRMVSLQEIG